ncbi:hypothetical protein QOT17_016534 [Balamuthia mandrillaris]
MSEDEEKEKQTETDAPQEQQASWATLELRDGEKAMQMVKQQWDKASKAYHLYPLFPSQVVEQIMRKVVGNVLDLQSKQPIGGNGNNLLITGVRGVGKTTLMKGLCSTLSVLAPKLICLYHDYELDQSDGKKALLALLKSKVPHLGPLPDNLPDALSALGDQGYCVAFFLDEVQVLFVATNHSNYGTYLRITQDILYVGKGAYNAFGVISGSSSNLRSLAYKQDTLAKEGDYPNLNNNVYREYRLSPIRKLDELKEVIKMIDSHWVGNVQACFDATGGVGRALRSFIQNQEAFASTHQQFLDELQNPAFFALMARLDNDNLLVSLPRAEIQAIVQPRLCPPEDFSVVLHRWLDNGFLYCTTEALTYEVLVPACLEAYHKHIAESTAFLRAAMLGTLWGWGGASSAGQLLERYICRRLRDDFSLWEPVANEEPVGKFLESLSFTAPMQEELIGRFFSVAQDTGVDGAFVCGAEPDGYHLHVLQVKCGRLELVIKCGKASQENATKLNDQLMSGIIAKAKRGIKDLITKLSTCNIGCPQTVTFTLFTTKKVAPESAKRLQQGFEVEIQGETLLVKCYLSSQKATFSLFDKELHYLALGNDQDDLQDLILS